MLKRISAFQRKNPELIIERIEFDIFGFSRGAAAARHFANELLKGKDSALVEELAADSKGFAESFAWRPKTDIAINFIGLFDTVAAIANPALFDFSGANGDNPGINLCLTADCANKVVQLVAQDEVRQNFALNSAGSADILLPGVHSDLGGGYLPRAIEKLLLSKPRTSNASLAQQSSNTAAYRDTARELVTWANQGLVEPDASGFPIKVALWDKNLPCNKKDDHGRGPEKRVYAAVSIERPIRGELSLVYLRIMRELAVKNGVPFEPIDEREPKLALPAELQPIAAKLQAFALGDSPIADLTLSEEALLRRRYIHLSAHWNAAKGMNNSALDIVFINRPTDNAKRVVHSNE
jgi:type VI secretion system secreted protein VgrG